MNRMPLRLPYVVSVLATSAGLASAAALTPGQILVATDDSASPAKTLYTYTTAGVKTSAVTVAANATPGDSYPRDIVVDPSGRVQIFNGTFTPTLTTYDPTAGTFAQHAGDFSIVNNVSYGGVAAIGNYVFVGDMNTANSGNTGILRFDAANGYSTTRFRSGTEYDRVSIGFDGLLYAIGNNAVVDVFNPSTMSLIRSVNVGGDPRALAVGPAGDLYIADWGGTVYHETAAGGILSSRALGVNNIDDIDLSPAGDLVIGGRFGDVVLTTTALTSQTSFKVGGTPVFVAFTTPVPEPGAMAMVGVAGIAMLRRRRAATPSLI